MGHFLRQNGPMDKPLPRARIETLRSGVFTFQVGVDWTAIEVPLVRFEDAYNRLASSPLAQVANVLEREVLTQSVFGTNTIEGARLSEEETDRVLTRDPGALQSEQEWRVRNLRAAYAIASKDASRPDWRPSVAFVRAMHREICRDLDDADNRPGVLRDNPKHRPTVVGDEDHGGRYKPPQAGRDIETLLNAMFAWHDELIAADVPALIRAPLMHLYFELIHPFWDGNGRIGRVLEATILRHAGYQHAPFALAKFYLERMHEYFALFNSSRKLAQKDPARANTAFVSFHLEGLRVVVDRLHDRVNELVKDLLFESGLRQLFDHRRINARQYAIVRGIIEHQGPLPLDRLRTDPRFQALYAKTSAKTRQRDLQRLRAVGLVVDTRDGGLVAGRDARVTA